MPSTRFAEILAMMSTEQRAKIAEGAMALRERDAKRKAQFVKEQEAAEYLEVTVAHLRTTRMTGALPGSLGRRAGRTVRYRIGDLDAFVDTQRSVDERQRTPIENT
jgi:hypothetical protein